MNAAARELAHTAYIGLGTNLGDREGYLRQALSLLQKHPEVCVTALSGVYETDPVGMVEQGPFLNMVAEVGTALSADRLLRVMQEVELALGRKRDIRWGPRTIDLDLLLFDDVAQDAPELVLPHPRMMERAFVLVPLIEVMSSARPEQAEALLKQLKRVDGKEGVRLWTKTL